MKPRDQLYLRAAGLLDDVLAVAEIGLPAVEGLEEAQMLNHGGGDIASHALHSPFRRGRRSRRRRCCVPWPMGTPTGIDKK